MKESNLRTQILRVLKNEMHTPKSKINYGELPYDYEGLSFKILNRFKFKENNKVCYLNDVKVFMYNENLCALSQIFYVDFFFDPKTRSMEYDFIQESAPNLLFDKHRQKYYEKLNLLDDKLEELNLTRENLTQKLTLTLEK